MGINHLKKRTKITDPKGMIVLNMKRFLLFLFRRAVIIIVSKSDTLSKLLELDLMQVRGKGIGESKNIHNEVFAAAKFLNKLGIERPIVLDIGANVGLFSRALLEKIPNAKCYLFEPSPTAIAKLNEILGHDHRVTIFPFALGKETKRGRLYFDNPGSGLSSLTRRRLDHFNIFMDKSHSIDIVKGDDVMRSNQIFPHYIKIDVEGHEMEVLLGLRETIEKAKVIQFEFGGCNIDTRTFFQDFWYFFTSRSFTVYRIARNKVIEIPRYSEVDECFLNSNYLCIADN
jgi:FkbM family methyltransferase